MRKIYESNPCGWDIDRAETIIVYELEEGEYETLDNEYADDYDALLESLGYHSEWGSVMPGARFDQFYVRSISVHHLVIAWVERFNV